MCIRKSVGLHGQNDIEDVMTVQVLINLNLERFPNLIPAPLSTDGRIGPNTLKAIAAFEMGVMGLPSSDSVIAPGDATVKAMLAGLPSGPTKEKLSVAMPQATRARIDLYFDGLVAGMRRHEITSPLRIAHFIAQIAHESGCFLYAEELASGDAYNGRTDLGNLQANDGPRFKGRGLIQLTGRNNYTRYSNDSGHGREYVDHPERIAEDPALAVDVACWFWKENGLNELADHDDLKGVTRRINGGYNGLDKRNDFLFRAKAVLGLV